VEVAEGAILSFFSDLNPNKTAQSVCFKQVERTRFYLAKFLVTRPDWYEVFEKKFWNSALTSNALVLEFWQLWSDCGFEVLLVKLGIKTSTLEGLTSAGINFGY
jgi:hypothetical protein